MICGCRGTTALQPIRCRAVALRQPHFVYVLLMGFAPTGLCSGIVFVWQGLHCISPLPENGKNPATKNVAVSVFLFIFAVRNQQKYKCVHVQSISMTV